MPIPHQEMRRMIKRRIRGLEGAERIRVLRAALADLPGYYQGPYGQIRKWILDLIAEAETRRRVRHQQDFFPARQGLAQVVLLGAPNAGKSSLLHALTGRQVVIGDYPFTTLAPVVGMVGLDGAQVQLVDLPGLTEGAADGRGGGRAVLAAVRMADAALHVIPLSGGGLADAGRVEAELARGGVEIPWAVVATKSDCPGASDRLADVRAAYAARPFVACSAVDGTGLPDVRRLIWDVAGLIRVFCKPPRGEAAGDPVVLRGGDSVQVLVAALNRAWLPRARAALVTGRSSRFPRQRVGLDHVLRDGDVVEILLG